MAGQGYVSGPECCECSRVCDYRMCVWQQPVATQLVEQLKAKNPAWVDPQSLFMNAEGKAYDQLSHW